VIVCLLFSITTRPTVFIVFDQTCCNQGLKSNVIFLVEIVYKLCQLKLYFRLHWMRVMQTIVTDVLAVWPSVCLSVTLLNSASLCKDGWMDHSPDFNEHSWGSKDHCVRWGPDPPQRGEGDFMQPLPNYFGLLLNALANCYSSCSFHRTVTKLGTRNLWIKAYNVFEPFFGNFTLLICVVICSVLRCYVWFVPYLSS